jgi:hypothetical protein
MDGESYVGWNIRNPDRGIPIDVVVGEVAAYRQSILRDKQDWRQNKSTEAQDIKHTPLDPILTVSVRYLWSSESFRTIFQLSSHSVDGKFYDFASLDEFAGAYRWPDKLCIGKMVNDNFIALTPEEDCRINRVGPIQQISKKPGILTETSAEGDREAQDPRQCVLL